MTKSVATTRRVTSDWALTFSGFDVWRPMHLLRRIGPVVQGICLDRSTSGDEYTPTVHVHALTREFPVISLMLGQRLQRASGQPEGILFSRHESDFQEAARALSEQSKLPLDSPPSLESVVREYHSASISRQQSGLPPPVKEIEDSIFISAAVNRRDLVAEGLNLAGDLVNLWPKARLPLDWVSSEVWLDSLTSKASDSGTLSAIVDRQVIKHKLGKIRQSFAGGEDTP
ncbi:hypothetical protein [Streptomyces soliscabiei]|uniref:hypothetical protein n=1 Tax=Streptomyces soliscabiei TaxID=588897 RepID=UPI0029AA6B40|nr:hypothetical protein [Streptomyces sp. NY05-11A]MDX2678471.1 hypothetical protein [Streptomyces sp. NY05-11A]